MKGIISTCIVMPPLAGRRSGVRYSHLVSTKIHM